MNKFYSMLGLARRGGKISAGYDATCAAMQKNKDCLVVIAADASDKTRKNILYFCEKYGCRHIEYGEKEMLGKSLGKKTLSVLAVNDENIIKYLLNNV